MSNVGALVRATFRRVSDGSIVRVIRISVQERIAWVIRLVGDYDPEPVHLDVLNIWDGIPREPEYIPVSDPYPILAKYREGSPQHREAMRKTAILDKLFRSVDMDLLVRPRYRPALVAEFVRSQASNSEQAVAHANSSESGKPVKGMPRQARTINAWLRRFWQRGMTTSALATDHHKGGAPGKRRNKPGRKKSGPKRRLEVTQGSPVTEEVYRHLETGCRAYLHDKNKSVQAAYDWLIHVHYSTYEETPGSYNVVISDNAPTLKQFKHYLYQRYSKQEQNKKRAGEHKFALSMRSLLGRADQGIDGPGRRFLIDATTADEYCISRIWRQWVVGRPTLYLVVDAWSRMIVGLYVGLNNPSWQAAALALINTVTNKKTFCERLGIGIDEEDWPCQALSQVIMGDKGELLSLIQGRRIVEELKIDIENAPSGRADAKGIVERDFGTVQMSYGPFTPGYVAKDAGERGAPKYQKNAVLDVEEFAKIVVYAILAHNNKPLTEKEIPPEAVAAGILPTPLELWKWGCKYRSGFLRHVDRDQAALNILPEDKATVTERGVKFKGRHYTFNWAEENGWFERARQTKSWPVSVSYDSQNLASIYVRDAEIPNGFAIAHAIKSEELPTEISLPEYEQYKESRKKLERAAEKEHQKKRSLQLRDSSEIVKQATENTNAAVAIAGLDKPIANSMKVRREEDKNILNSRKIPRKQQVSPSTYSYADKMFGCDGE